jgi:putative oxidoreductase
MLKTIYPITKNILSNGQSVSLLLARLTVAYGFYEPAMQKWSDISSVAGWFGTLGIPFPTLNAYLAASTELLGVVLLTLGLFTRLISLPLMVVMVVAITTVHLTHGFSAGDNGFEIPLYYLLFLALFASLGAGKLSLDHLLFGEEQ